MTTILLFNIAVFLGIVIEAIAYVYLARQHRMKCERAWIAVKIGQAIACTFMAILMVTTLAGHYWPPVIHYVSLSLLGVALLGAISTSLSRLTLDIQKNSEKKQKPAEPIPDKILALLTPVTMEADRGIGSHHNDCAG